MTGRWTLGNSASLVPAAMMLVVCGALGCDLRIAGTSSKPTESVATERHDEPVQAEADEPPAKAKPAGKSAAAKAATPKPAAGGKAELIGAARNSLATGGGQLPAALLADKLELRDVQGKKKYAFKNKGADAVKFYDADGDELCKLTVTADKLKVKSADDKPLFELKYKADKSSLRLPPDDREQWKFKPKGDRLEIHSGDDRLVGVVRADGDAAVVLEKSDGGRICRAERKGGSTIVTDASGATLLSSAAIADPLALVFFGWTELNPSQQAACLVYFLRKST